MRKNGIIAALAIPVLLLNNLMAQPVPENDIAQLGRYRDANAHLKPPADGENRVVFLGDSITDYWPFADYFPGKPYINRGIGGQTTSQMLARFQQDVIDLKPKVLVLLAGTNDLAKSHGPVPLMDTETNYTSITKLARSHGIRVICCSLTPVNNYSKSAEHALENRPPEKILALNRWIKDYCAANDLMYLDYFDAMVDKQGLMQADFTWDGVHPNPAGYKVMASLASAAIKKTVDSLSPRSDRPAPSR